MAAQKGPRRSRGKERFWRRIVEGQAASRVSVRKWCDRHGVSEPSFYAWRRELAKRDGANEKPAVLPVTIRPSPARAPLEICWPSGVVVRVPPSCDWQLLRGSLEVLRSLDAEPYSPETKPC